MKHHGGHQAHYLIADNVVQKSNLHTIARKKGLYDLDRKANGINLAETVEDFANDVSGASSKLPLHKGSHPDWDFHVEDIIKVTEAKLVNKYGKLDIPPISKEVMEKALSSIEEKALRSIQKLPVGVKLK